MLVRMSANQEAMSGLRCDLVMKANGREGFAECTLMHDVKAVTVTVVNIHTFAAAAT